MNSIVLVTTLAVALSIPVSGCQERNLPTDTAGNSDVQKQIHDLQAEIGKNPDSEQLHNQLAILYADVNDVAGFEEEIKTAIRLRPDDPINYFQAFLVYERIGMPDPAKAMLRTAIALDPDNPVFEFKQAQLLRKNGDPEKAKQQYFDARRLLAAAIERGIKSDSDHALRPNRIVKDTYYDRFNNAYSTENLKKAIDKALTDTR